MIEEPTSPLPRTATEHWLRLGGVGLSVIALALIIAGFFVGRPTPTSATVVGGTPQSGAAPVVGALAPDFTLRDTTATPVHLGDLRGRPVILSFWYVACEGCKEEMPLLQRAYQQHAAAGLVVLGIDVADSTQHAVDFERSLHASYPLIFDTHQGVLNEYLVTATPTSIFIDRQGVIRAIFVGTLDDATLATDLATIG